ncbi:AAA family ATPase [Dactylosporangium aurantiacum]|uniref:AAA family ATPase n=1 Tax=Dactylosporangium aurantiacum TaxID=35754 RepID=A0A9Q9IM41_9ACTN|nr:LuxR family transcriptional regulator [Dactylosporangium aurantiacum]MDG6110187.1 AAA family ATPase [Dactylosporangium aurantiacum]UWZ58667.1 AAA family ATPase [Dactylosporangium aurantiacum]
MSSAEELVGRDAELAVAADAVRALSAGRASVLAIEGEAGIGKTRMVQSVVDDARSRGMAVFSGQAHPFERTRPFGVVAAALGLSRRSADPRAAAIGAMLAGVDGAEPAAVDVRYRVVEEIVDLVETGCAARPVLLVVEDIHWADSASLLAILSVARQLPLAPLLVLVTTRPSPPADAARLLDDLAAGGARTLRLPPLSHGDVVTLAGRVLGAAPGPALTALLAKAGGNPLWAASMLRSLADEGVLRRTAGSVETTTSTVPASLGDLVIRRMRPLSRETVELLRVAAVLGDAVSLRDVAAVDRRSPTEIAARLGDAFDARILDEVDDRVVFRHQLVHDAIYQHIPPPSRRLLHREAAVALMAAGANRLDVADHLMLGAERGDNQAVAWLRDAAREASTRAPSVTVELLRRAEALLPAGHRDADLVSAEVVQALLRAGEVAEASDRAEAMLARPHATVLDTPLRVALVGALALQNRAAELIAVVEASLAARTGLPAPAEALMLAQQSWALTYTDDPRAGESAARRALSIAEHAGDAAMTVWALTGLLVAVGRQGRFEEALGHARRAAGLAAGSRDVRSLPLQPKFFLGLALFDCDLVAEARAAYRQALDDEFGAGWWVSDTLMADAQASFAVGEWADAAPGLVAGGEAAVEKGNPLLVAQSLAYRVSIATGMGDHRTAGELAAELTVPLAGERLSYNAGIVAYAVAGLKAAEGDQVGAYDLLLRCWRCDAARENRFYHRWLAPDLVRLALAIGHRDVAAEVADAVAAGVALAPGVPTVRALALRCRALVDRQVEPAIEAVALARQTPLLVEHAGAAEDAAELLTRDGRRDEAAALLAEALARYEQAGADAWAGRVRARLRSLGVRPGPRGSRTRPAAGWDSLTSTQRAVSMLVAEGLTNGAVARRLYISPHTVNSHLRHVYAKLGVPNRVALAAVVHHSIK